MADDKKAKKTSEKKTSDKKATSSKNGKSDKKKSGKNPFTAIGSFFKSVRSEGKKVVCSGREAPLYDARPCAAEGIHGEAGAARGQEFVVNDEDGRACRDCGADSQREEAG